MDPDDHPWYGIPFPGTYVIDAEGSITAKFFESNLAIRANGDQLLRAAKGESVAIQTVGRKSAEPQAEVSLEVILDGESLATGVLRDLIVCLRVPDGQHLYGKPVPEGMVATTVEFEESEGLVVMDPIFPPTSTHVLNGTGEELQVFEGDVVIQVPITHNQRSMEKLDDGSRAVRVAGTVRWQSCDDDVCHLPASQTFELLIPAVKTNSAKYRRDEGSTGMDAAKHLAKMTERRR